MLGASGGYGVGGGGGGRLGLVRYRLVTCNHVFEDPCMKLATRDLRHV